MNKLTNGILTGISLIGGFLVTQNLVTAGQLSDVQSILGMALAGGGISIGMIIAIIKALPTQLVSAAYDKAVAKYGPDKVDSFVGKVDVVINMQNDTQALLQEVKSLLEEAKEQREELLNE